MSFFNLSRNVHRPRSAVSPSPDHSKFTDAPAVLRATMWAPRKDPPQLSLTMQDSALATGTLERVAALVHSLRNSAPPNPHAAPAAQPNTHAHTPPPFITVELVNCAVVSLNPAYSGPLPVDVCQYTVPVDVALELPLLTLSLPHATGQPTPPLQHPVEGVVANPVLLLDAAVFASPAKGASAAMVEVSGAALQVATMAESGILHDDVVLRAPHVEVHRRAGAGPGDAPALVHVDVQGVEVLLRPSLVNTLMHAALCLAGNVRPPPGRRTRLPTATTAPAERSQGGWQRHLLTEVALTSAVVYANDDLECALVHVGLQGLRVEAAQGGGGQRVVVKWSQVRFVFSPQAVDCIFRFYCICVCMCHESIWHHVTHMLSWK